MSKRSMIYLTMELLKLVASVKPDVTFIRRVYKHLTQFSQFNVTGENLIYFSEI